MLPVFDLRAKSGRTCKSIGPNGKAGGDNE
jgi:hypothetical protein